MWGMHASPRSAVFSIGSIMPIDITVAPVMTGLARESSTKRVKVAPQVGALENVRRCRVRHDRRGRGPKRRWDYWPTGLPSEGRSSTPRLEFAAQFVQLETVEKGRPGIVQVPEMTGREIAVLTT